MTPRQAGWAHQKQPDQNAQTAASFRVVTPLVLGASRKFRATLDAIAIRRHHITHYLNPSSAVSSTISTPLALSLPLAIYSSHGRQTQRAAQHEARPGQSCSPRLLRRWLWWRFWRLWRGRIWKLTLISHRTSVISGHPRSSCGCIFEEYSQER